MHNFKDIAVIILAAGKGKRMQSDLPKALTPLRGKPFIVHILETLRQIDPNINPIIVLGHKKEEVIRELGENRPYATQTEQLGTGHAVLSAKESISGNPKTIFVISGDQPVISKETIEEILKIQEEKNPTITLATVKIPDFKEWRACLNNFGRIIRSNDGKLEKITELKDASIEEQKIRELNLALYAFDSKWLWENIDKLKNENTQGEYYLTDLLKIAFEQGRKIETVEVTNPIEAIHPNSKEELEILENLL